MIGSVSGVLTEPLYCERTGITMSKSMSGPDWYDVGVYLNSISDTNDVSITLLLDFDGSNVVPRWRVSGWTGERAPLIADMSPGVGASVLWPHRNYRTMEGAVFNLLATIDVLLAQKRLLQLKS
jgi:hypothetical protein